MITDGNLRLASAQSLSSAQYNVTTNCIDLSVAMRDVGQGEDLMVNVLWTTGATGAAGATVNTVVYASHLPVELQGPTNVTSGQPALPTIAISATSGTVITASAAHGLVPGVRIRLTTQGTFSGLALNQDYYVRSVPSTTTFEVSATPDGAAVGSYTTGSGGILTPQVEVIASTGPQAVTRLAAGAALQLCVNPSIVYPGTNAPRYLCVGYIGSASIAGAWTVDVALTPGDGRRNYPVGFSVT